MVEGQSKSKKSKRERRKRNFSKIRSENYDYCREEVMEQSIAVHRYKGKQQYISSNRILISKIFPFLQTDFQSDILRELNKSGM